MAAGDCVRAMRAFYPAFFLANLVLSSFYLDIWCTPNPVSRALPVLALLQEGSLSIDRYAHLTLNRKLLRQEQLAAHYANGAANREES